MNSSSALYKCRNSNCTYELAKKLFPNDWLEEANNTIRSKNHPSLIVKKNEGWYYFGLEQGSEALKSVTGGRNPIDFLINYKNYSFSEAADIVASFIGIDLNIDYDIKNIEVKKKSYSIKPKPTPSTTNHSIIKYLTEERGLSKEIVKSLISSGLLFQTNHYSYPNACFYNPANNHFEITGTTNKRYKQVSDGRSTWEYKVGNGNESTIIFESAIDALSYYELFHPHNCTLLSLSGSCKKELLEDIIASSTNDPILAVDNDTAGKSLADLYPFLPKVILRDNFKDWNDMLCYNKKKSS